MAQGLVVHPPRGDTVHLTQTWGFSTQHPKIQGQCLSQRSEATEFGLAPLHNQRDPKGGPLAKISADPDFKTEFLAGIDIDAKDDLLRPTLHFRGRKNVI